VNIILGPPGTGKTTSLLSMVEADLASGVPPDRIGYVTFTRRGAEVAIDRACKKFRLEAAQLPYFRTLHSLCYRELGVTSGEMLVGNKFFDFANYARIRVTGRSWSDDGLLTGFEVGDRILFMENLARIRQVSLREQYELSDDNVPWNEVVRVQQAMAAYKSRHGLLDYTDMLTEFANHGQGCGLQRLYVDEAQDLSSLQWRVVQVLSEGTEQVTVAGDDDQAIYRWAGADVEHLIRMDGSVRVLAQSFRVPPVIQKIADGVIGGVRERRPKTWRARRSSTGAVDLHRGFDDVNCDDAWVEGDPTQPVLVLARNLYVLREQVEPTLRREGVVYERNGKSSIDAKVLAAIVTWEDLRAERPTTLGDVRRMYDFLSTGVGVRRGFKKLPKYGDDPDESVTMRDLVETGGLLASPDKVWHEALDKLPSEDMSYMLAARRRGEKLRGGQPRVRISTIHSAKGGEARHVVLMTEMAKRTHAEMELSPDDERRVWYVGVTRAKEKLSIVSSETNRECPWL
jgi:DNA helicase-2/ATP-dependent DNA helicase PcrA